MISRGQPVTSGFESPETLWILCIKQGGGFTLWEMIKIMMKSHSPIVNLRTYCNSPISDMLTQFIYRSRYVFILRCLMKCLPFTFHVCVFLKTQISIVLCVYWHVDPVLTERPRWSDWQPLVCVAWEWLRLFLSLCVVWVCGLQLTGREEKDRSTSPHLPAYARVCVFLYFLNTYENAYATSKLRAFWRNKDILMSFHKGSFEG